MLLVYHVSIKKYIISVCVKRFCFVRFDLVIYKLKINFSRYMGISENIAVKDC